MRIADPELSLHISTISDIVNDNVTDILAHMDDDSPNECVGLIWDDGTTTRLVNQARSSSRFSVSQRQMSERLVEKTDDALLIAIYHSHPQGDPTLSPTDKQSLERQFKLGLFIPWVIVTQTEMAAYWLHDNGTLQHRWVWEQ